MSKATGAANQQGAPGPAATVSALLRSLHINHNSAEAQRVALRRWLIDHTPSKALRISLRSNGYGVLLRDLRAEGRPMPPITATHRLGA
ncbi:MAG: hypothetical protein JO044_10865 [Mycobacteriaceae bacterium]|nr:hypothetical protein [Mycobacteriaceae bacterium]MBV9638770.1 hypothetical protein [Mycobacteriaceae bacterium]